MRGGRKEFYPTCQKCLICRVGHCLIATGIKETCKPSNEFILDLPSGWQNPNEQWKKGTWLFREYRGWKSYPIMCGLFHKLWNTDPVIKQPALPFEKRVNFFQRIRSLNRLMYYLVMSGNFYKQPSYRKGMSWWLEKVLITNVTICYYWMFDGKNRHKLTRQSSKLATNLEILNHVFLALKQFAVQLSCKLKVKCQILTTF